MSMVSSMLDRGMLAIDDLLRDLPMKRLVAARKSPTRLGTRTEAEGGVYYVGPALLVSLSWAPRER